MTDDHLSDGTSRPDAPDADTLAVHAVLDGEAGADERRRVASDPALLARLAEARAARDAVATAPPPPGDDVLAAVRTRALDAAFGTDRGTDATALTATGEGDAPDDPHEDDAASVTSIAEARTEREARARRRLPPLPAVAAVVILLVLVGVGLLVTDDGGGEQTAADSAAETTDETERSADAEGAGDAEAEADADEHEAGAAAGEGADGSGGAAQEAEPRDETSPDVAAVVDDLLALATAAYPGPDDLLVELRTVDTATLALPVEGSAAGRPLDGDGVGPDDAQVARCDVINSNQEGLEPATAATVVSIDQTPVVVTANHDPSTGGTRLTVMELPSCIPLGGVAR